MSNKPIILIVDDNPHNLELLSDIIKNEDYVLETVYSGKEALRVAHRMSLDLVLLDVNMPEMDGYEVCRHFKADDKLCDIPILFLSAMNETVDKLKGFEVGGVDYITKPFYPNEVLARMKAHLTLRNVQQQLQTQNHELKKEISRRKQAETKLRKSEEKYRSLFEKTNDAVFIISLDFKHIDVNPQAATLLGYTVDELIGKHVNNFIVENESTAAMKQAEQLLSGAVLPVYERTFRRKNGNKFTAEINVTLICDNGDNPLYFHSVVRDISEKKQLQNALKESEQRYRQILENASEAVFTTDLMGFFTFANPVMAKRSGYSEDELIGKHFTELIDESWQEQVLQFYQKQFVERIHETVLAFPLLRFQSEEIWVEQTTNLIWNEGEVTGFLGIARDISESRKIQEALRKSERQLSRAQQIANMGSFEFDINTGNVLVSEAMYKLFKIEPDETNSLNMEAILEWIHPEDVERLIENQQRAIIEHHAEPLEFRIILPDKTEKIAYSEAEIILDESGNPMRLIGMVQDITDRKMLENALIESERLYRELIENALDIVYTTDEQGNFTYINNIGEQMLGYSADELIGQHFTFVIPEECQQRVLAFYVKQFQDRIRETRYEVPVITRNQEKRWIEQTTTLLTEGKYVIGFQSIGRDVTERKAVEAERENLIAELDAFAHTVAHDLKNPLGILKFNSNMLETMFDRMTEEIRHRALQRIQQGTQKMAEIIDALLLLSSVREQDHISITPLNMNQIVTEALQRLNAQVEENHAEVIVTDTFPIVFGYAPWIEEVWVNYLSNALKYGGNPAYVEVGTDTLADRSIRFWVKDNGAGLSSDDQAKLFTPFTRLNQVDIQGHGLGLSIVQRIIDKLGGTVGVISEVGKGSQFYFTLPTKHR